MTDLRLPPREKVKVFLRVLDVLDFLRSLSSGSAKRKVVIAGHEVP